MLYDREMYTADISYLNNIFITEYDISKANISILRSMNIIDKDTYDWLYNSERMVRQIYIGKLQKDNEIAKKLSIGFKAARRMLFESNNIQDREVLSIKKDAVYIINRKLQNTKFGLIEFKEKNIYTAFYKFKQFDVYYYYNNITKEENIDIKGINDKYLKLHENAFLQLLKDVFYTLQVNGPDVALRMLKDYYILYISRELPLEHYRRFGGDNKFYVYGGQFSTDIPNESLKSIIDLNYNAFILMELQKIIIDIYFSKHR